MRLVIIPIDKAVYLDEACKSNLDLSACNIPKNVHALQWFDVKGWIEFNDDGDPFTPQPPNEIIEQLPQWADDCVAVWEATPFPPNPFE